MDEDIRGLLDSRDYREAFELLLDRYQHKVFRLAYSMLGDEASAEEMAQDVFVQIWKVLPSYRGEASLSTWIYVITRNRCLTLRKKMHERRTHSMDEPGMAAAIDAMQAVRRTPAHTPDCAELLEHLPLPYRQAVILFYLEEKSYEEVAAMLDVPLGTVKTYLHRARKQLAASIVRVP